MVLRRLVLFLIHRHICHILEHSVDSRYSDVKRSVCSRAAYDVRLSGDYYRKGNYLFCVYDDGALCMLSIRGN
jgi:hypothetical protein